MRGGRGCRSLSGLGLLIAFVSVSPTSALAEGSPFGPPPPGLPSENACVTVAVSPHVVSVGGSVTATTGPPTPGTGSCPYKPPLEFNWYVGTEKFTSCATSAPSCVIPATHATTSWVRVCVVGSSSGDGALTACDYAGVLPSGTFALSGTISGAGAAGATITATSSGGTATTTTAGADGTYYFGLPAGTYTVTVTLPNGVSGSVSPPARTVALSKDTQDVDFTTVVSDVKAEILDITQGIQPFIDQAPGTVSIPGQGEIEGDIYKGVPLVAGVPAVVRVIAGFTGEIPAGTATATPAVLRGFTTSGGELPGGPLSAPAATVPVKPDLLSGLESPSPGYTFSLPVSWTEHGSIALVAEVNPEHGGHRSIGECPECVGNDRIALGSIGFTETKPIQLTPFQVDYTYSLAGGKGTQREIGPDLTSEWEVARAVLPLAPKNLIVKPFPATVLDISRGVQDVVHFYREHEIRLADPKLLDCMVIPNCRKAIWEWEYAGVTTELELPHDEKTWAVGYTPFEDGVTWPSQGISMTGEASPARPLTSATHEFLHLLGFQHASPGCGGGANGQVNAPWPPDELGLIHGRGIDRVPNADGGYRYINEPTFDLMSYCTHARDSVAWISTDNWRKFVELDRVGATAAKASSAGHAARDASVGMPGAGAAGHAAAVGNDLIAVGSISSEGKATLLAAAPTAARRGPAGASAKYQLKALNAHGRTIADIAVEPLTVEDGEGIAMFSGVVPGSADKLELISGGKTLASKRRPSPRPRVRLARGTAGVRLVHGALVVHWSERGAHGTMLTARVQYELSAKQGWKTLIAGVPSNSYSIPLSTFGAASSVRIRVIVSDGFSIASATSRSLRLRSTAKRAKPRKGHDL